MKLKVYAYKGCGTCRKALRYLESAGVPHEVVPIREQPPTPAELDLMRKRYPADLRRLFNTSGRDYRELKLKDRLGSMSPEEAVALLAENGNLIKRPFVVAGRDGWVGFDPAEWEEKLQAACPSA